MKFATRLSALFSLGFLLNTTACTDYAEEFKEEHKGTYGVITPEGNTEIPTYDFESAYLVWQGYADDYISETTSSGFSPFIIANDKSSIIFHAKDESGNNFATNSLDDISSIVSRSGGLAGSLYNADGYAEAGVAFRFESVDLSDESSYSGIALALGSTYASTNICLLHLDDNGSVISEYCCEFKNFANDTLVRGTLVPFSSLEYIFGESDFNKFMGEANAIMVSFAGDSDEKFSFNIVALGFYSDGSSYLKSSDDVQENSSESADVDSSEIVKPKSSGSVKPASSASVAPKSSNSVKPASSASVEPKSSADESSAPRFVWNAQNGSSFFYDKYTWKWKLAGNYNDMWMVPEDYVGYDANEKLDDIIQSCGGICGEIYPNTKDSVLVSVKMEKSIDIINLEGVCVDYVSTARAYLRLHGLDDKYVDIDMPKTTSTDQYSKFTYTLGNTDLEQILLLVGSLTQVDFVIKTTERQNAYFNLITFGSLNECSSSITLPTPPEFVRNTTNGYFKFGWNANTKDDIFMWFDGDTITSEWESNGKFGFGEDNLTAKECVNKQGYIYTTVYTNNNPEMFFYLKGDKTSQDITDWQGICVNYNWKNNWNKVAIENPITARLTIENENGKYSAVLPSDPTKFHIRCFEFGSFLDNEGKSIVDNKDGSVNAEKIKISFTLNSTDGALEGAFELLEIGEYSAMKNSDDPYFTDNIIKSCNIEKEHVLMGDTLRWNFTYSSLYNGVVNTLNPTFVWFQRDTTSRTVTDSLIVEDEGTQSYGRNLRITLDDGVYQNIECPTGWALYRYQSCVYETAASEIAYGKVQTITLNGMSGKLPDSLVTVTWKDAVGNETENNMATLELNEQGRSYTPVAYIEYYNGIKDTITCDTMKIEVQSTCEGNVLYNSSWGEKQNLNWGCWQNDDGVECSVGEISGSNTIGNMEANISSDGEIHDISEWGGLCITYKASTSLTLAATYNDMGKYTWFNGLDATENYTTTKIAFGDGKKPFGKSIVVSHYSFTPESYNYQVYEITTLKKVDNIVGPKVYACGETKTYNPDEQFCDSKGEPREKCGGEEYNDQSEFCGEDGKIYNLCNNKTFSPLTEFCNFDNNIETRCNNKNTEECFYWNGSEAHNEGVVGLYSQDPVFTWPVDFEIKTSEYNEESGTLDAVVSEYKAVVGRYGFEAEYEQDSEVDYFPYNGVAFSVGKDISSWDGICITYTSTDTAYLKIDIIDNSGGGPYSYERPVALLPKTRNDSLKTLVFTWNDFMSSYENVIGDIHFSPTETFPDMNNALKMVKSIDLTYSDALGKEGYFSIYEIGSFNQCSGVNGGFTVPDFDNITQWYPTR
ncbi:MAG: hypothetical protein MJZ10_04885 [Fibrobacter sp.]|nr:hypothetical protein [Fibrobacter sp.]